MLPAADLPTGQLRQRFKKVDAFLTFFLPDRESTRPGPYNTNLLFIVLFPDYLSAGTRRKHLWDVRYSVGTMGFRVAAFTLLLIAFVVDGRVLRSSKLIHAVF